MERVRQILSAMSLMSLLFVLGCGMVNAPAAAVPTPDDAAKATAAALAGESARPSTPVAPAATAPAIPTAPPPAPSLTSAGAQVAAAGADAPVAQPCRSWLPGVRTGPHATDGITPELAGFLGTWDGAWEGPSGPVPSAVDIANNQGKLFIHFMLPKPDGSGVQAVMPMAFSAADGRLEFKGPEASPVLGTNMARGFLDGRQIILRLRADRAGLDGLADGGDAPYRATLTRCSAGQ
jgi:hypothetical protein